VQFSRRGALYDTPHPASSLLDILRFDLVVHQRLHSLGHPY
jgi:hypothetical protein